MDYSKRNWREETDALKRIMAKMIGGPGKYTQCFIYIKKDGQSEKRKMTVDFSVETSFIIEMRP